MENALVTSPEPQQQPAVQVHKRRRKLIKPGIQLALSGLFAGISILSLLLQALLFSSLLTQTAERMPVGGTYLLDMMPTLLLRSVLFSIGIVFPLTIAVGVLATFRIAGPIYRFETYLKGVIRGDQLGPCKIRKGDALTDLCELINDATAPVRRRESLRTSEDSTHVGAA